MNSQLEYLYNLFEEKYNLFESIIPNKTIRIFKYEINTRDLLIILFFIGYLYFSVWFKYNRYTAFASSMDYHSYLQMFWNTSEGRLLEYNGLKADIRMMFNYHFAIILIPFAFIYSIFPHQLTGYHIQSFLMALSVVPLYLLAKDIFKNRLAAYLMTLIFILYPPFINVDLAGFAEENLAVPFGLFALYFLQKGKSKLTFIFCALLLYLRINLTAIVFSIGLLAFIKGKKILGVSLMVLSVLWLFLIVFVVNRIYPTPDSPEMQYIWWFFIDYGNSPFEIAYNIITKPELIKKFVFVNHKLIYFNDLFYPLFYLPIASPYTFLASPIYAISLISNNGLLSSVYMHYHATIIPFIFFGLINSIQNLNNLVNRVIHKRGGRLLPFSIMVLILMFINIIIYNYKAMPARLIPFTFYYNKAFYSVSNRDKANYFITKNLPKSFSISTDEIFMEHIAERLWYWDTPNFIKFNPDLVLLDYFNAPKNDLDVVNSQKYKLAFSNLSTKLYARNDLYSEYELTDKIKFEMGKEYIIKISPKYSFVVSKDVPTVDIDRKVTVMFDNHKFAQKFKLDGKLDYISLNGYKNGFPKGSLVTEIRGDDLQTVYFKKYIRFSEISWEQDIIRIQVDPLKEMPVGDYYLVLYMDYPKNLEKDSFVFMNYKDPLIVETQDNMLKDRSGKNNWIPSDQLMIMNLYYNFDKTYVGSKDIVVLQDGSLLMSGYGDKVSRLYEEISSKSSNNYESVIVISK